MNYLHGNSGFSIVSIAGNGNHEMLKSGDLPVDIFVPTGKPLARNAMGFERGYESAVQSSPASAIEYVSPAVTMM